EAVANSVTIVTTNVWYHIAGVRGANYLQLYVNGQLESTVTVNFPQNYGKLPLYFGTSGQSYWDGKFRGQLDEVSLYNRALASNEISAMYQAGSAGKCKGPRTPDARRRESAEVGRGNVGQAAVDLPAAFCDRYGSGGASEARQSLSQSLQSEGECSLPQPFQFDFVRGAVGDDEAITRDVRFVRRDFHVADLLRR
ncbi:MAG: LamG domain-containing protein, partial [Ignavibacteria bacterium]